MDPKAAVVPPDPAAPPVVADPQTPAQPFKAFATQADFDEWKAKATEAKDKELAKLRRESEEARAKSMTEDEKRLADAKAEGRKEVETQLEVAKREAAVLRHLAAKLGPNATDEQLADLAKLAGDGDPKEAVEALAAKWPGFFTTNTTRAPGGGGGRNITAGNPSPYGFDATECQRAFDELGPTKYREWHAQNRAAILAAQGMEDGDGMKMSASMTSIGPQPKR
ncbi:MAG: hypothetical protein WC683_09840 [bacterium]